MMSKTYCVAIKRKGGKARDCVIIKFQVLPEMINLILETCTDG